MKLDKILEKMVDYPTILLGVLLLLVAVILIVLGIATTVSLGSYIITVSDQFRVPSIICGILVLVGAIFVFFVEPSRSHRASERVLRAYYTSLNRRTPDGFEQAWNLLSESKRARFGSDFGWYNSQGFSQGYVSTFSHDPVFFQLLSKSNESVSYQVMFIVDEETPSSQVRDILLGTEGGSVTAKSILNPKTVSLVEAAIWNATVSYTQIEKRDKFKVDELVDKLDITSLLSPNLLETIRLKLKLQKKPGEKVRTLENDNSFRRTKTVQVHRRRVVKEKGEWHMDDVEILGMGMVR